MGKHPHEIPTPLTCLAFGHMIRGHHEITFTGLHGESMELKIPEDHPRAPRDDWSAAPAPPRERATLWPFYSRTVAITIAAIDDHGERVGELRDAPGAPVDPLHESARAAIEKLGLDGARMELAVAVFGWGSPEANGSLGALVRLMSPPGAVYGASYSETDIERTQALVEALELLARHASPEYTP